MRRIGIAVLGSNTVVPACPLIIEILKKYYILMRNFKNIGNGQLYKTFGFLDYYSFRIETNKRKEWRVKFDFN